MEEGGGRGTGPCAYGLCGIDLCKEIAQYVSSVFLTNQLVPRVI